ncbi:MAG: hypothetical protein KA886_04860 [Candidatus Cloacimonetes bacterium]|nr:hypothetical protein [Candidatus Cloacimonadota bacterium]
MYLKNKERIQYLNLFKAILVIGMISGHAVMLLSSSKSQYSLYYKNYINLITFSGFLFAFGIIHERIISCSKLNYAKFTSQIFKLLTAFYISGISYRILVKPGNISFKKLADILILKDIPGYSEFLLAFTVIQVLGLLLYLLPEKLKKSIWLYLVLILISVLSTIFIKKGFRLSYPALIFGSNFFGAFPVLQYSAWFFAGILYKWNRFKLNIYSFIVCLALTCLYITYYIKAGHFAKRFPPSFFWITGSAFPLWVMLKGSLLAEQYRQKIPDFLFSFFNNIGENTLFYLIISNIALFALSSHLQLSFITALLTGLVIVIVIHYLTGIIRK